MVNRMFKGDIFNLDGEVDPLTIKQRQILELYVKKGLNVFQIADKFNITPQGVSRHIQSIIAKNIDVHNLKRKEQGDYYDID